MVKLAHNPFTPTFGCVPPELAGRDTLITDILEGLDNAPGDPNGNYFRGRSRNGQDGASHGRCRAGRNAGVGQRQCNRPIRNALGDNSFSFAKRHLTFLLLKHNSWLSEIHVHGVGFTRTKEEAPSTWRADMTKAIGRTQ